MGQAFFAAWQTWEKLVFILACAIVITVLLGCAKLGHTHYKLRKYSAIAERDKREQAMHRQMSQRRKTRTSTDVPFGIRAIESGVEVEGVWISRNNSPEPPSSRDTSRSSVWDATAQKLHEIDLEKQTADLPHVRAGRKLANGSNAIQTAPLACVEINKPVKSKQHPPLSYAKYSGNPSLFHQAPTVSTIEGIEAIHRASGPVTAGSTHGDGYDSRDSSQSTGDSIDTEPISSSAPNLLGHRPKQQSTELDMMHSHRLSQAAETGQLTPRVRRPGARSGWSSVAYEQRPHTASDSVDHFRRVRARSESPIARPATGTGYSSNRLAHPPSLDSLPIAARRTSLPDVTPFAQFCRTAPILPRPEIPQSVDSYTSKSAMQQVGDSLTQYMSRSSNFEDPPQQAVYSRAATVTRQETATNGTVQAQPEQRFSFEHRSSAIVRGHGSGFEILRPGTFAEHVERHRSAPPVNLCNNSSSSKPRSSSSDNRRKLQKRRPSTDSQASSSSGGGGRWSRVSVF